MKKIISIFTVFIFIIALSGCGQKDLQSSDTVSNSITSDQHKDSRDISDNELIDLAIDISKEENNYTYWLFSAPVTEDESDIIQEEYSYTLNGEKFSEEIGPEKNELPMVGRCIQCPVIGSCRFIYLLSFQRFDDSCSSMAAAARRPSPMARMTVAPPRTMSPPA